MIVEIKRLASGQEVPVVGLGTWELTGSTCTKAVKIALDIGYRHIDTAYIYGNHAEISRAIKEGPVDRSELFITSKVWKNSLTREKVLAQTGEILRQLGTDYVDLLLVHWPTTDVPIEETISAFEEVAGEGAARSIGVSNFTVGDLEGALEVASLPIVNNQVKFNPQVRPVDVLEFCREKGISVTAYSPLARGEVIGQGGVLGEIAGNWEKTTAQVTLRWLIQKGLIVIPKASSRGHLEENLAVMGWELRPDEMKRLDSSRRSQRLKERRAKSARECRGDRKEEHPSRLF